MADSISTSGHLSREKLTINYVGYVKLMWESTLSTSSRQEANPPAMRDVRRFEAWRGTRLMLVICLIGGLRRGKWKHCALTTSPCGNKRSTIQQIYRDVSG